MFYENKSKSFANEQIGLNGSLCAKDDPVYRLCKFKNIIRIIVFFAIIFFPLPGSSALSTTYLPFYSITKSNAYKNIISKIVTDKRVNEERANFKKFVNMQSLTLRASVENYSDEELVKILKSLDEIVYDIIDIVKSKIISRLKVNKKLDTGQADLLIDICGDYGMSSVSKIKIILNKKELSKNEKHFVFIEIKKVLRLSINGMQNYIIIESYLSKKSIKHESYIDIKKLENLIEHTEIFLNSLLIN